MLEEPRPYEGGYHIEITPAAFTYIGRISSRSGSNFNSRFCTYAMFPRCDACADLCPIYTSPFGRFRDATHSRKFLTWSIVCSTRDFTTTGGSFGSVLQTVESAVGLGAQRQIQLSLRFNF